MSANASITWLGRCCGRRHTSSSLLQLARLRQRRTSEATRSTRTNSTRLGSNAQCECCVWNNSTGRIRNGEAAAVTSLQAQSPGVNSKSFGMSTLSRTKPPREIDAAHIGLCGRQRNRALNDDQMSEDLDFHFAGAGRKNHYDVSSRHCGLDLLRGHRSYLDMPLGFVLRDIGIGIVWSGCRCHIVSPKSD